MLLPSSGVFLSWLLHRPLTISSPTRSNAIFVCWGEFDLQKDIDEPRRLLVVCTSAALIYFLLPCRWVQAQAEDSPEDNKRMF